MSIRKTTIAEELKGGNTVTYFTKGVSMCPLLYERKTVVVISPAEKFNKNDIVLYLLSNGAYVLHRLIKQDDKFYYMRGDNTYTLEKISKSQALGVVTHISRKDRQIDVNSDMLYKIYVNFWNFIFPLRRLWWICRYTAGGVLKKIRAAVIK